MRPQPITSFPKRFDYTSDRDRVKIIYSKLNLFISVFSDAGSTPAISTMNIEQLVVPAVCLGGLVLVVAYLGLNRLIKHINIKKAINDPSVSPVNFAKILGAKERSPQ